MAQQQRIGTVSTTVRGGYAGLSVVYHSTEVVVRVPTGIKLDSGGWRTSTTKLRMNQASNEYGLGFQVYQRDRRWFVRYADAELPFVDGMILPVEGGR